MGGGEVGGVSPPHFPHPETKTDDKKRFTDPFPHSQWRSHLYRVVLKFFFFHIKRVN